MYLLFNYTSIIGKERQGYWNKIRSRASRKKHRDEDSDVNSHPECVSKLSCCMKWTKGVTAETTPI